ncbi:CBASS oligonucleotide cyclase [Streptomyces sp. SID1121]|uniref:CBASS oligonucleotide cyclase n=1 Tax=Streptomyces sp. SID1121 TaxID=3425888 RepID=UPI00405787EF
MPQIGHADLVAFAGNKVNLKKIEVDDQRAQVNRLRERISAKISATPGYGLVKSLHAGSVAKGTALSTVHDRDLAVYVKAEQAPEETPALVEWVRERIVEAYPTLAEDQIVAKTNCVTVTFVSTGLEVDVVPVLYEGDPNDIGYLVSKVTGEKLKTSVRQHLDFIRGRKKDHPIHLAQLIRFTKWWAKQQAKRDASFKCKSFMLELLWVHVADHGLVELDDYAVALEQFFAFIVNGGLEDQIAFTDFQPASELPARGTSAIQVLDPVNFENNVAEHYEMHHRDLLVAASQEAFNAISTAYYEPAKGQAVELWQDVLGTSFKAAS